ncbi:putative hAT family C-terminal dimerization region-containing protein 18 [Homarus americanus]|uniref:Putative hAT family C-terminal dimerization region-containing protein 18 n=1 Tax=Homarus americanus TaxID=6706 RepID=A0A8J5JW50_HOMAM|nr:putative hAT family C-terminal dimerization region-containing protein 18 [Homarus americanus]
MQSVKACNLQDIDMDELYEEYGIVEAIINTPEMVDSHSEERYLKLFSKSEVPFTNLKTVSVYIFSISCSNAQTERVFSMTTSARRNERNRLQVDSVKAELQICNFSEECPAMYKKFLANRKLLEMASKGQKYKK